MGEIADSLLDGTFDAETGEYLGEGPGFERIQRGGEIVPRHHVEQPNPYNGIMKGLRKKFKYITKKEVRRLMEEYTGNVGKTQISNRDLANIVSSTYSDFMKFAEAFID